MKVYIDGVDSPGWSVDVDRKNIQASLKRLNIKNEPSYFKADIVHNIRWDGILKQKNVFLRLKKNILVTSSNFINLEDELFSLKEKFEKVKRIANAWIVPSMKQKKILESYGLRTYYQPFYLDLSLFIPRDRKEGRKELLKRFSIPPEKIEGKIIIGSFQRDSLGSDLGQPKWQKGPDLLVEILKDMPGERFILLLVGPRRHWIKRQCIKYNIPHHFIGTEHQKDDILLNSLDITEMPYLYSLVDIYLVTSKSEGGPKAVMEATATKTVILSTDVGLAPDFLNARNLFQSIDEYKKAVLRILVDFKRFLLNMRDDIEEQYKRSLTILNYDAMDQRLLDIYKEILNC